jgi:hypothetical protein
VSTTTTTKTLIPKGLDARVLSRTIEEGYGPGAWHGPDLRAALADVTSEIAFWRPAPERHSIAEIAVHHAYVVHSVRQQLSGASAEPFVLEGEDWFPLSERPKLTWPDILRVVEKEHEQLAAAISGGGKSAADSERFELVLGITCHAVYHAGQIQLLKRLRAQ